MQDLTVIVRKIPVTPQELRELYLVERLPMEEMARRKHCSVATIYHRLCEAGIPHRSRREAIRLARGLQLDDREIATMYKRGLSSKQIADQLGCSPATVLERLRDAGVAIRSRSQAMLLDRGVQLSKGELDKLYVKEQRSAADIAGKFGCTTTTIYRRLAAAGIRRRSTAEAQVVAWRQGKCTPKPRTVTPSDSKLRVMYIDQQLSISDIAKHVGCSLMAVQKRLRAAGIPERPLSQAQRLAITQGKRRVVCRNPDFLKRWSREMAYVLGVIVTDGNLASDKPRIMIAQRQRELLDKVDALIGCQGGISWTGNRIHRLSFQSPEIYEDLQRLGLTPRKSRTVKWPPVPREYLRDFVRGCWDGDGSVSFRKWRTASASFYSGSLKFIKGMRQALVGLGLPRETVRIRLVETPKSRCYQLHLARYRADPLFEILYADTREGMYLSRKRELFGKIAQESVSRTLSRTPNASECGGGQAFEPLAGCGKTLVFPCSLG
jgi:DNA-directed RNA polymerase specialized sigma24 family protein